MLYGLDLFSGIGGITKALDSYVIPIAYCENDAYANAVKLSRMVSQDLPLAPIWDDIRSLEGKQFKGYVDIVYGGFPCQDISVAGNGKGLEGERSRLFYEIVRLTQEINPSFVFLENVPAIRTRGLREVVREFTEMGYDCRWTCLSASSLGAPHKRERWFLLAHSNSTKLRKEQVPRRKCKNKTIIGNNGKKEYMADSTESGLEGIRERLFGQSGGWEIEPEVGRVVNELPFRVDRIKCLGNSVVPLQAKTAFEKLMGIL